MKRVLRFLKAAIFSASLITLLMFAACGSGNNDEDYEPQPYYSATEDATEGVTEQIPYDDNAEAYDFLWPEGRDRYWEQDIIQFAEHFLSVHPLMNVHHAPEFLISPAGGRNAVRRFTDADLREDVLARIDDLKHRIPELEDFEIKMTIARITALVREHHTAWWFEDGYTLPISVSRFYTEQHGEGFYPQHPQLYIMQAAPAYPELLNTRLLAINGVCMDDIFQELAYLIPHENENTLRTTGQLLWMNKYVLRYLEVVGDLADNTVILTVRTLDGEIFDTEVAFMAMEEFMVATEDDFIRTFWSEKLAHSRPDRRVWFEHLADEDMMYVRVTSFWTEPGAPQVEVWREMWLELEAIEGVGTFVLDVRNNRGGDDIQGLFNFINWLRRSGDNRLLAGKIYVAIDHYTASNGVSAAVLMSDNLDGVTIIGAPTAGAPNGFVDWSGVGYGGNTIMLNNSGMWVAVANQGYTTRPGCDANTLLPDIFIYTTAYNHFANRDALMELIFGGLHESSQ